MCVHVCAAKFEEAEENVPSIAALSDLTTMPYPAETVHQTEVLVLDKLGWTLTVVTPVHFIGMFFKMVRAHRLQLCFNAPHTHPHSWLRALLSL